MKECNKIKGLKLLLSNDIELKILGLSLVKEFGDLDTETLKNYVYDNNIYPIFSATVAYRIQYFLNELSNED